MGEFWSPSSQIVFSIQGLELSKEFASLCENSCSFNPPVVSNLITKNMNTKDANSTATTKLEKLKVENHCFEKDELLPAAVDSSSEERLELKTKSIETIREKENNTANEDKLISSEENLLDACTSFLSSSLTSRENNDKTLLQMASEFRTQNPRKWSTKDKERKKRLEGSSSKIEKIDSFLDSYYERQVQLQEEKKEKEKRSKWEIPRIFLQLTFHTFPNSIYDSKLKLYENLFENYNVFEKKHTEVMQFLPGVESTHEKHNSELHIVITKGKFLLNHRPDGTNKFDSCKVTCYFYPGTTNIEEIDSTEIVYLSMKGTAKWEHAFVLKDYSVKDLENSYLILSVVVKRNGQNEIIGKTILAGKNAKVWDEKTCLFREPVSSEIADWTEALKTQFTTIHSASNLIRPIAKNTSGIIASLSQTFTNIEIKD